MSYSPPNSQLPSPSTPSRFDAVDWPVVFASVAFAFLITLGFLNPFAYGPTSAAYPQLLGVLCVGLLFAVLVLAQLVEPEPKLLLLRPNAVLCALAGFAALSAVFTGAKPTATLVAVLMFALGALLTMLDVRRWLRGLVLGVLAAALINLLLGVLQFLQVSSSLHPWVNYSAEVGMVYGNLRQPNQYASLMALGLAALWWLGAASKDRSADHPAAPSCPPWLIVVAALGLVTGTVLSASRAGALQLLLIAVFSLFWMKTVPRTTFWTFALLPVAYLAIWLLLRELAPAMGLTLRGGWERSVDGVQISRLTLYQNVVELIAASPWRGYGAGELGYAHFMHDFGGDRHMELIDNAHNIILQSWVELGLLGVLLVVLPFTVAVLRAKLWAQTAPPKQFAWLVIACLALHSGLEYPLHYAQFWMPFCLALALVFKGKQLEISQNAATSVALAVSATVLAGFAYLAWDYDRVSQAYGGPQRRAALDDTRPIGEALKSTLFRPYALFAKVTTQEVTPANAAQLLPELLELLHFSAEPRVLDRLIVAQLHTGALTDAMAYAKRYKAAFAAEYASFIAGLDAAERAKLGL